MNLIKILWVALVSMILSSCETTYYQVYKAVPSTNLSNNENCMIYEDENCKVLYNLWREGGNIGFQFYNKTSNNIYLKMDESFLVVNGISYDYFANRVFTESESSASSSYIGSTASKSVTGINYLGLIQTNKISATNIDASTTSTGLSVSYAEEKNICIPSKTSKIISKYNINRSLYTDCSLLQYPTVKEVKPITFSREQSPLVFGNRITYSLGHSDNVIRIENEFYVTEITNYPDSAMFESGYKERCGNKSTRQKIKYFKDASSDKFYITYNR